MTILTSSKSVEIKECTRIKAIQNSKCFISFLFLYFAFLILADSMITYINYIELCCKLQCILITIFDNILFLLYLITIIFLLALLYNLAHVIDELQGKNSTEQTSPKNTVELSQQENIHIHIHKE